MSEDPLESIKPKLKTTRLEESKIIDWNVTVILGVWEVTQESREWQGC